MTRLAGQGDFAGTQEKRTIYHFWKKEHATWEEYRNFIRSCRKKIRERKSQLEISLATLIRDNKKWVCKYISNEKRAKENVSSLLDVEGNIAAKDNRMRYLSPSLL